MAYQTLILEQNDAIWTVKLNRPEALNALNSTLIGELGCVIARYEHEDTARALILTGSEKAFAAGADIKEMHDKTFEDVYKDDFIEPWECVAKCKKPIIAAVSGYALGGGCELAMMCDFILASHTAKFGQPEITIGTIPGAGGTQRLTKLIGKSKAMEMCLTGRMISADEAYAAGLVARVIEADKLMDEALKTAEKIAKFSSSAVRMVIESVNAANELSLNEGLHFERRLFHATFATKDQKEGMKAFMEKREPNFA